MKKSIFLFFAAILCAIGASAATKTIYFKSQQWWHKDGAASAAYYWGTGGNANTWPGTRMTKVAGETNVWSIDIDTDKYQNIIFTRVNGSGTVQDWGAKTEDLVIPTDDKNFFTLSTTEAWDGNKATGTWSVYTPTVTHTFAKNSTLYVDFRAITDASKKGANYPKAGSVGIDYSANAGGTVIPVTFTADVKWAEGTEFIKTDKGGWASIPFKAPEAGQNCAQVAADGKSYTWTVYSEPSVTLSLDKTQADAGTNVTVTLTATADNVSGEVTYAFQYSTDNATWNNITATGNTATQTFAAETRYYKVTMTNGGTTKEATAKFSAIKFHIIGSWDSWAAHNEVVEGSKTITLEANKTYEYKITNGTWDLSWGNDGTMDRNNCTDWSFESNNNAKIKTDEAGDYVFNVSRNAEGKVKVSVVYPELSAPIPTFDYYIAGNMNGWDKAHVEYGMTDENADGIYEKEITLAAGQDHQFKVTNGKWGNEDGGFDCATVEGSYEEVDSKDGNVLVKLNTETTFTVKFNKNTEKITFEGLTETETETLVYTVEVPEGTEDCYIAGQMNDWEFERMTQVNATQWTITYDNVLKTTEYKYACQASWDYVEKKADGNELDSDRTWTENDVVAAWGKPTYTVAGNSEAAFGTTWDPSNTANDMTLEGGLYKWTKTNVALYKNTVIKFQVVKNHDWSAGQWPGSGNDWVLNTITEDGLYTITITFKEDDKTINATANKTGEVVTKDFSNQPAILYFHPSFHWTSDYAQFAAYFYNNGPGADATPTWVNMTDGNGDGIYEVANAKQHEYVIICRMNPSRTENNWEDEVMWNQIEHGITIPNTAGDLNTCLAFWTNCQGDVPTSECTWVAPTPLTDKNWAAFVAAYNGKTINAVVERSFTSGQKHTLCLPFNLPTSWLGDGSKAYQLNSIFANTAEELQLNASECNTIEAGKPYIIVPVKGSEYEHIIVSGVTVKDVDAGTNVAIGDGYKATLKAVTTTGGQTNGSTEYYVGANDGKLYNAQTDKLGLRAIIELTTTGGQPLPAKVRAYVAAEENEATGFENIVAPEGQAMKVIENGQLIIIRGNEKFNAQGVRL